MLNLFRTIDSQGRKLCFDFTEYTFLIGLRSDDYEPISFKLGIMLNMTKVYILLPV